MKRQTKFKKTEIGKIPEDWEVKSLREIAEVLTGFPFKGNKYSNKGIKVLRGENVSIGFIRWDTEKRWNEEFSEIEKYSLREGDFVIGMDGSRVGMNRSFIDKKELPLLLAQRVARLRAGKKVDQKFIGQILLSRRFFDYIEKVKTGTSIPHISSKQISEFLVPIPPLPEQLSIASILCSLDEKIEINNKMNKTLEAIGQTIFKKWFINERKEDWKVSTIGKELRTILGGTPDRTKPEYWNGDINWINSGAINDFPIINASERITELGLNKSATQLMPKKTIVLPFVISVGKNVSISILGIKTAGNQSVLGIIPNEKFSSSFIYWYIQNQKNDIYSSVTGGAQQHINKANVNNTPLIIPDEKFLKKFNLLVEPLIDLILKNAIQNQTLSSIRDALLPKLMSGEIRVN